MKSERLEGGERERERPLSSCHAPLKTRDNLLRELSPALLSKAFSVRVNWVIVTCKQLVWGRSRRQLPRSEKEP